MKLNSTQLSSAQAKDDKGKAIGKDYLLYSNAVEWARIATACVPSIWAQQNKGLSKGLADFAIPLRL